MEILRSLASQLGCRFPFNQIFICDGDDYPVPTIIVSPKRLTGIEVVVIKLEDMVLKLEFYYDVNRRVSTNLVKPFFTFDIADPKFDPEAVSSALAVMLRGQERLSG